MDVELPCNTDQDRGAMLPVFCLPVMLITHTFCSQSFASGAYRQTSLANRQEESKLHTRLACNEAAVSQDAIAQTSSACPGRQQKHTCLCPPPGDHPGQGCAAKGAACPQPALAAALASPAYNRRYAHAAAFLNNTTAKLHEAKSKK